MGECLRPCPPQTSGQCDKHPAMLAEDAVIEGITYLMKLDRWLTRSGSRLGDRHYRNAMTIARGGKPAPHAIEDLVLKGEAG